MDVYEEGGAAHGKGEATIVCGVQGESLPGTLTGGGAGFAHVRFAVEDGLLVSAHWRQWDAQPVVWTAVGMNGDGVAAGTSAADAPDYLRPAVEAAIAKAMCEGCTHAHYGG